MPAMKLVYFPIPGKAEPVRLTLAIGGVEFEDEKLSFEQWGGERKAKVAPLQLPQLEVSGKVVSQSMALLRYAGKLAKHEGKPLYPSDAFEALLVDEMLDVVHEAFPPMAATFALPDGDEKNKARAALCQKGGPVEKWAAYVDSLLAKSSSGFAVLDRLTVADVAIFAWYGIFRMGFLDGVPKDSLDHLAHIVKHKKKIGSLQPVADYYRNATGLHAYFKN